MVRMAKENLSYKKILFLQTFDLQGWQETVSQHRSILKPSKNEYLWGQILEDVRQKASQLYFIDN